MIVLGVDTGTAVTGYGVVRGGPMSQSQLVECGVLRTGHARGVILLAAANARIDIAEYPPAEIKKTVVGTGSATKEQVQFMVTRLLRLKTAPHPADAADGVAAALAHLMGVHLSALTRPQSGSRPQAIRTL